MRKGTKKTETPLTVDQQFENFDYVNNLIIDFFSKCHRKDKIPSDDIAVVQQLAALMSGVALYALLELKDKEGGINGKAAKRTSRRV